jgi:hypothetical protein
VDRRSITFIIQHLCHRYRSLRNLSNHYHVVLHINQPKADTWSTREICTHWHQLFSGFSLSNRFLSGEPLSPAEEEQLALKTEEWRQRLMDISWFMRCLNDKIIWNDFEQLSWP